jgi:hypothetical protein
LVTVFAVSFLPIFVLDALGTGMSAEGLAIVLPLGGLTSYLIGMLVWDVAYVHPILSLFPCYVWPLRKMRWLWRYLAKKDIDPRYWHRMDAANRILEQRGLYLYAYGKADYARFRTDLVRVTESCPAYLGPRISAEWERLSLYIAVAFSSKVALAILGLGLLVRHWLGYESILIKYSASVPWALGAFLALVGVVVPIAFERRNQYLGRDVGLGIARLELASQGETIDRLCSR